MPAQCFYEINVWIRYMDISFCCCFFNFVLFLCFNLSLKSLKILELASLGRNLLAWSHPAEIQEQLPANDASAVQHDFSLFIYVWHWHVYPDIWCHQMQDKFTLQGKCNFTFVKADRGGLRYTYMPTSVFRSHTFVHHRKTTDISRISSAFSLNLLSK